MPYYKAKLKKVLVTSHKWNDKLTKIPSDSPGFHSEEELLSFLAFHTWNMLMFINRDVLFHLTLAVNWQQDIEETINHIE
jgi:hypothetical protein